MKRFYLFALALALGFAASARAQIRITEVMYDATNDDIWQWVEIENTGGSAINMDGYFAFNLGDFDIVNGPNPSISSSIDPDTTINAGERAIIYDGFYGTNNPDNFNDQIFRNAWGLGAGVKLIGAQFFPLMSTTAGSQGQSIGFWPDVTSLRADMTPAGGGQGAQITSFGNAAFSLDFSQFPVTNSVNGHSSITWTGNGISQSGANWIQSGPSSGAVTSTQVSISGGDVGNPGIVTNTGTFPANPSSSLYFTEIMFNPIGTEPNWEWVELYNNSAAPVDLAGYVIDDTNSVAHSAANQPNIAAGTVPAFGTAILYNSLLSPAEFEAAWGPGLNLVPVTDWAVMGLNNSGTDGVGLWSSTASYAGDHQTQANTVAKLVYDLNSGWPAATNQSIYLTTRNNSTTDPFSWSAATAGVDGSFSTGLEHPGGDVGSPGTFTTVAGTPGDFDNDGDVDGRDFLIWQRGGSPNGVPGVSVSQADLIAWQGAYGNPLTAAVGAVPEPASVMLLALALTPLTCGRKR